MSNRNQVFADLLAENTATNTVNQRQRLAKALIKLGSVTTFEAMRFLGIYDPRPRKLELLAQGFDIALVWDTTITEDGAKHRIGRYVLKSVPDNCQGMESAS
jgi:hypothetical protein